MRRLCTFVLLVGIMSGCAPWKIVHQAKPNPFAHQREFAVAPVDFSRLDNGAQVGPLCGEPTNPKDDCREILAQEFVGALTAVQGLEIKKLDQTSAPFVIRAQVLTLDPGMLSAKEKRSSQVVMHVRIERQDGGLLDELRLKTGMKPTPIEPTPGFRVWMDGGTLGEHLRTYLRRRAEVPGAD